MACPVGPAGALARGNRLQPCFRNCQRSEEAVTPASAEAGDRHRNLGGPKGSLSGDRRARPARSPREPAARPSSAGCRRAIPAASAAASTRRSRSSCASARRARRARDRRRTRRRVRRLRARRVPAPPRASHAGLPGRASRVRAPRARAQPTRHRGLRDGRRHPPAATRSNAAATSGVSPTADASPSSCGCVAGSPSPRASTP